jgi:hypothetical protein
MNQKGVIQPAVHWLRSHGIAIKISLTYPLFARKGLMDEKKPALDLCWLMTQNDGSWFRKD